MFGFWLPFHERELVNRMHDHRTADEVVRELTENYDRLMLELRNVVTQLARLTAMKDVIEEAGGELPPHVVAGLRKLDAHLRDGDVLKVAN